jgi:ectoine hydroxylase-related dioxygenase (phytanoyl-CoA dioxygenase family)
MGVDSEIDEVARYCESIKKERVIDDYKNCEAVCKLAFNRQVMDVLFGLYDAEPFPFQVLSFPDSPSQDVHSDQIHFSSIPFGHMAGAWLALADVELDMGPLFVVRGSHKLPHVYSGDLGLSVAKDLGSWQKNLPAFSRHWEGIIREGRLLRSPLLLRRGQVAIWASNLLHGSFKKLGGARRLSQVTHYFFRGFKYCTPGMSDFESGDVMFRRPFELLEYARGIGLA